MTDLSISILVYKPASWFIKSTSWFININMIFQPASWFIKKASSLPHTPYTMRFQS